MTLLRRFATLGLAVSSLTAGASGCASDPADRSLCAEIEPMVEDLLGESDLEEFSVERLEECVWTATDEAAQSITVRVEDVPDAQLFVEHAIEATAPDRVIPLDFGDGAVLFADEALLGREGDRIALITATIDTDELSPLLERTLELLRS